MDTAVCDTGSRRCCCCGGGGGGGLVWFGLFAIFPCNSRGNTT